MPCHPWRITPKQCPTTLQGTISLRLPICVSDVKKTRCAKKPWCNNFLRGAPDSLHHPIETPAVHLRHAEVCSTGDAFRPFVPVRRPARGEPDRGFIYAAVGKCQEGE